MTYRIVKPTAAPASDKLPPAIGEAIQRLVRLATKGRGVSGLFLGIDGTGKTMAAERLAQVARTDVFLVDLSRVVSKYIGETEKNLAVVFSEVGQADVQLFFDEADALFGKRTDVSDSHDRYADREITYLLQRIESFAGIVILATNSRPQIDDAILRRFRVVVPSPGV
jgi:SpoVK/Ycf46/Vps4 family AAA+-type ATPase